MALRARGGKWYYRFQLDGKRYGASTELAATKSQENREAALAIEAARRLELIEGRAGIRKIAAREFSSAAGEFLSWVQAEHRSRPNTAARIKTSFRSLADFFGSTVVTMIDERAIEGYKAYRRTCQTCSGSGAGDGSKSCRVCLGSGQGVRDVTLRHDLHALSKFFRWAIRQRFSRYNPVQGATLPSDAEAVRIHVLSGAEEKAYFQHARGALRDLALLMVNQGCRPEELLGLRKADVDLDVGRLRIEDGKTKAARRTLTLTNESIIILARRMVGGSEWVFPSPVNPGKHLMSVNTAHRRVREKSGVNCVPYDLRHTFATRMAQAGCDLATLAAILGHASLRMVMKYVHPTEQHQAAAMMRYAESRRASQPAVYRA